MQNKTRLIWLAILALFVGQYAPSYFGPSQAARNGSGSYTVPNTFTPGSTITSSAFNQNFSDMGSEITNSLALDGQSVMTGQFKAAVGSVSAPGIAFGSDTDTGLYRIGSNNMGVAAGGAKVVDISSSGIDVTGAVTQNGTSIVPVGTIFSYTGSSAPTGYLLAYGQCVSRTTYASLFAVLSTTYDNGCAGTDFGIPDLRGRMVAGKDNMGGSAASRLTAAGSSCDGSTIGTGCGAQTVTLLQSNLPDVSFNVTDSGHTHASANAVQDGGGNVTVNGGSAQQTRIVSTSLPSTVTASATTGISVSSGGSDSPVKIVPPALVLNYIIKH